MAYGKSATFLMISMVLAGCGSGVGGPLDDTRLGNLDIPGGGPSDVVVRSRAYFRIDTGSRFANNPLAGLYSSLIPSALAASIPVTVVNAASTSMTLDTSQFAIPAVSNALLEFGFLNISSLFDNKLSVCGPGGDQKCGHALIRIYTSGTPGAGLWNTADGYGMPISGGFTGSPANVGLDPAGAAVVQSYAIPANKRVLRLSDFSPTPHYEITSDFTDAGAGSYSTTLVLEYALTL